MEFGKNGKARLSGFGISTTSDTMKIIHDDIEFSHRVREDTFPPVMSYFEPYKRTSSGENFIQFQRKRFSDLCHHASKIIIIGLKIRPHDEHIWSPIANSSAELIYCSGKKSGLEFVNWCEEEVKRDGIYNNLDGYFKECFDKIYSEIEI